jgi:predicted DNA-binding transcriptional regulator AlpA
VNFLSIDDVAEPTGLSSSTLAKRRCSGTGPAYFKIGRHVRYSAEGVDTWIASRRRTRTWRAANDNATKRESE